METAGALRLYTPKFLNLCASYLLFMASFNMIIPELPAYLTSLGGEDYKGYIIGLFAITALVSRPFSGKLADTVGRLPVMFVGAAASCICSLLYPWLGHLAGFMGLRLLHGLSTGFLPTGSAAYLSDIVPQNRRGEALGILGVSGSLGMAGGPAFGGHLALHFGTDVMFYGSAATALLSILLIAGSRESLQNRQRFSLSLLKINRNDLLEPRVFVPSFILLLTAYSFGTNLTLIPDLSDTLGLRNRGLFFTIMLAASILVRIFSGRATDRWGSERILLIGTFLQTAGMALIALSGSVTLFVIAALVFGLANGLVSPGVFSWTVMLANDGNRGRAVSTMYMALELGILVGSFSAGWIYGNNPDNFIFAFGCGSLLSFFAFIFLVFRKKKDSLN